MARSFLRRVVATPPVGPHGYPLIGIARFVTPHDAYELLAHTFELLPDGGVLVTLEYLDGSEESFPVHRAYVGAVGSPATWAHDFAAKVAAASSRPAGPVEIVWRSVESIPYLIGPSMRVETAARIEEEIA